MSDCVFCQIVENGQYRYGLSDEVVAIQPLNPVTPGHMLVVPREHVESAVIRPLITAETMRQAAEYAADAGPCNLITSVGADATQTVFHLHIHVVPRRPDDGLHLPWTGQEKAVRP